VEDEDLRKIAKLRVEGRSGLLRALIAFVLVFGVELADFELLLEALCESGLTAQRQRRERLVCL